MTTPRVPRAVEALVKKLKKLPHTSPLIEDCLACSYKKEIAAVKRWLTRRRKKNVS